MSDPKIDAFLKAFESKPTLKEKVEYMKIRRDSLKTVQDLGKLEAEGIRRKSGVESLTKEQRRVLKIKPPKPVKPPKKPTEAELKREATQRVIEGTGSPTDSAAVIPGYWEKRTEKPKSAEAKATDNYNEIHKRWKVTYGQWKDAKGDDKKRLRERLEDYERDLLTLEGEIVKIRKANREKLKKLDISKYEVK